MYSYEISFFFTAKYIVLNCFDIFVVSICLFQIKRKYSQLHINKLNKENEKNIFSLPFSLRNMGWNAVNKLIRNYSSNAHDFH
jgi:hypothetical protein